MRFACWINMTTGAHLEYVILIASPQQQWLRQHAAMCRSYVQYIACVVSFLLSMSIFSLCCPFNFQIIRHSLTQNLFYIQYYICQGDMFRLSRSSSDPSRTQIQALFRFPALWDPKCLQFSVIGVKSI